MPALTLVLIAVNIVLAFASTLGLVPAAEYAFDPFHPSLPAAAVCLFLHQNVVHLLGNMVFLAAVGPVVEGTLRPVRFLTLYLCSGLVAVAGHWLLAVASGVGGPLIGASGAIAGTVAYASVRYLRRRVPLAPRTQVPVVAVVLAWLGLQALGAFVKAGSETGVSYWAHLFGFLGGLLMALVFRAPMEERRDTGHGLMDEAGERSPAALLATAEEHLRSHPDDPRALIEKARAHHAMHEPEQEAAALLRLVALTDGEQRADVVRALEQCGGVPRLSVLERMRLASQHADLEDVAVLLYASVAREPRSEPQRPYALMHLLELRARPEGLDPGLELLEHYALHEAAEIARNKGLIG